MLTGRAQCKPHSSERPIPAAVREILAAPGRLRNGAQVSTAVESALLSVCTKAPLNDSEVLTIFWSLRSGLLPGEIACTENHGTGTALGDPHGSQTL